MNKNIKVKHIIDVLRESQRIMFCYCNWNGDTVRITDAIHVGDRALYSTYNERHVQFIVVNGSMLYIFI